MTTQPKQIGGTHYEKMSPSPSEFCSLWTIEFNHGNIIKYLCRWRNKNGIEDLKKAKQYIDLILLWTQKYTIPPIAQAYTLNQLDEKWLHPLTTQLPEHESACINLILIPDDRHYTCRYNDAKNIIDYIISKNSPTPTPCPAASSEKASSPQKKSTPSHGKKKPSTEDSSQ